MEKRNGVTGIFGKSVRIAVGKPIVITVSTPVIITVVIAVNESIIRTIGITRHKYVTVAITDTGK